MAEMMKSIVQSGPEEVEIWEIEKPVITASEVLVQTKALSLCTVEQRIFKGANNPNYPIIGGHEISGVITEVGADVRGYKAGDKIVTTFQYCGYCSNCKNGRGTKCLNSRTQKKRIVTDNANVGNGGMAQYAALPATQIAKIGDDVPFYIAALSEPLACCINSVAKSKPKLGETAVVIGAGIMGILHVKLLHMQGMRVIVSEVDSARQQIALNAGANVAFNPLEKDPVEYVKELTDGIGADIIINTTSIPSVWQQALNMTAPFARVVAYASQHPDEPQPLSFNWVHNTEIEIIGTVSPTADSFVTATKLMKYNLIDLDDVVDGIYSFENAREAFERAAQPDAYRCVIEFD